MYNGKLPDTTKRFYLLTTSDTYLNLGVAINKVKAVRLNFFLYTTQVAGHKYMTINIDELNANYSTFADRSDNSMFGLVPLAPQQFAVVYFANLAGQYDVSFKEPIATLNSLHFRLLIDGQPIPSGEISASNPVLLSLEYLLNDDAK